MLLAFSFLFLSPFLILTQFNCYANAGRLLVSNCSTDGFSEGSTYESNLSALLSSLSENAQNNSGFYSTSFGENPDKVYGLLWCYAEAHQADCFDCLHYATSNETLACALSASATVTYEQCQLSYSKDNFLSVADPYKPICINNGDTSLDQNTRKSLSSLLAFLIQQASNAAERISGGTVSGTNTSAVVQCSKDLLPEECQNCINYTMRYFSSCSYHVTSIGMRLIGRQCYIRYEPSLMPVNLLPKSLVPPPPPPPPPPPTPPPLPPPPPTIGSPARGSTATIALSIVVALVVTGLAVFGFCYFWRRKHSPQKDDENTVRLHENVETELEYILNPKAEYLVFNLTTLKIATHNFSEMNELGKGGFGPVYKGTLPGGREIAVKRLSGSSLQGITEFRNEVDFLAKLKHKNLVQLLGCCITKQEKLLCYEYLPNGSLDKILFARDHASRRINLGWKMRQKIIEGITRGLHYLHEESRLKIIHRDLKVSNILLDRDMNPKISDFGLAKFFEEDETQKDTSKIAGTFGYMAPEFLQGNFSAKSDVYSFGVLLLEIVIGQKNTSFVGSPRNSDIINHVLEHWNNGTISELKDPMLEEEFLEEIKRCVHIALLCVQENPIERPNMETVRNMLGSTMILPDLPSTLPQTWLTNFRIGESSLATNRSSVRSRQKSMINTSSFKGDQEDFVSA